MGRLPVAILIWLGPLTLVQLPFAIAGNEINATLSKAINLAKENRSIDFFTLISHYL